MSPRRERNRTKGDRPDVGSASKNAKARAAGRPPEEIQSGNPAEQAEVILEDSEDRLTKVAERSAAREKYDRAAIDG
jgi:hypothetical protein